jgi:hypothetical protein
LHAVKASGLEEGIEISFKKEERKRERESER